MEGAQELLDLQWVSTIHSGTCLYGVSYSAVRTVAAGGKVCLLALSASGAQSLCHDDRIDAAFVYVCTASWTDLESRLAKRLREDESTVQKRLQWAQNEVCHIFLKDFDCSSIHDVMQY